MTNFILYLMVFLIGWVALNWATKMTDLSLLRFFIAMAGILIIVLNFNIRVSREKYKRGQIDAINGKIKYECMTNGNKKVEWIYKKDVD